MSTIEIISKIEALKEWEADEATAATPTATGDTPSKIKGGTYHEGNHKDK